MATGHLGGAVIKQLATRTLGDRVAALVRDEGKAADLRAKGVKLCVGDYAEVVEY